MSKDKKIKHRPQSQAVQPKTVERIVESVISGTISGIITAAVLKLLGW